MEQLAEQLNAHVAELNFYRGLAKFSQKTWAKPEMAKDCASELSQALDRLLLHSAVPSDELVGHLAITINAILCSDYNFLHGHQQRSIPRPKNYDHKKMVEAFPILYDILKRIGFERVHQQINGSYFCIDPKHLFICPRRPPIPKYKYTHHTFVFPIERTPKYVSLVHVQHVVHNFDDLISILNLTNNNTVSPSDLSTTAQQSVVAHFKGGPHHAYHGPDIVWFAPLPSEQNLHDRQDSCPSLDSKTSCYGCYRFCIPFDYFRNYKSYILGTRQYDKEYCHTIMFTDRDVQSVKFIEELKSVELTDTKIIQQAKDASSQWLCYRYEEEEYDQLDFAVAASSLEFDPVNDKIRLDFVDHKACMRNSYVNSERKCSDTSRIEAMKQFSLELRKHNIDLCLLKPYFDEMVYDELQKLKAENNQS